jgi:hypothetical protein
MKKYQLKINNYILSDVKGLKFHIKSSDYFGNLASIITIIKETIENDSKIKDKKIITKILKNLIDDCLYLQSNYSIIAKNKKKSHNPKGIVKNQ